ncbi:MAG: hypothetical protein KAH86_09725, partial [Methanosarcinales archaeon]|nr:hypothetical protein [Methanosarcinales archaeon]
SVLGFADHDAFQTFISTLIFLLFLIAMGFATQSGDGYRTIISDKKTLATSIMFGAGMATGMYTWLGAPIFIAIVATYAFAQWIINCRHKKDSTPLISVCLVGSATALLFMLPVMRSRFGMEFTMNHLSLFHITFVGLFFMLWVSVWGVSHMMDKRGQKRYTWYSKPIAVAGIGIGILAILFMVVPGFYQAAHTAAGFMTKQTTVTSTIQETASLFYMNGSLSDEYIKGFFSTSFIAFIAGMLILIKRHITKHGRKVDDNVVFLIVWSLCALVLSALQIRFTNFFAVNVAILSGYTITALVDYIQSVWSKRPDRRIMMQILAGVVVLGIVIPTASAALALTDNPLTPAKTDWHVSLQWIEANTPPVSDDNPEYSVLSWWSF